MIHSTATVHRGAQVDATTSVGPYAVIDEHVVLGPGCRVGPHVYLTGHTVAGAHNQFYAGCVIGEAPQDLKYRGDPTGLRIGDHNVFREGVTVNRSTVMEEETVLGSHNLLMANCHVAHNVRIGNHVIIVNGVLLAGHVTVGDRAVLSGNCLVHQFVRIGTLAMMQGGTAISMDLPPFMVATGTNGMCGLNIVGLRRAGFPSQQRLELKRLYHALFRSNRNLRAALDAARSEFTSEPARVVFEFLSGSKRGVVSDVRGRTSPGDGAGDEEE